MEHVNEGSHSFICHPHVYPQVEWTIPASNPSRKTSPHFSRYSFPIRMRVGGWVGLGGLVKYCGGLPAQRRSYIPVLAVTAGNRTCPESTVLTTGGKLTGWPRWWIPALESHQRFFTNQVHTEQEERHLTSIIDWLKVFASHLTQNNSFRRHSPSQSLGLVWKTKPNTTKAHIHQSKEIHYKTK